MFPSFHIGGLEIPLYGIIFLAGLAVAIVIARKLSYRVSLPKPDVLYGALYSFIGILIGSKIVYFITMLPSVIKHWNVIDQAFTSFWGEAFFLFNFLFGGYVYYGGLIGAVVMLYIYCRTYKVDFVAFADLFAVLIPFVHGIGRIGCFLAGCCYGIEYHGFLSVQFPYHGDVPELSAVPRFPVQLLETGLNFIFFGVLLFLFIKVGVRGGKILGIYLIYYSIARFGLEMLRGDSIRGGIGILSTSQIISAILLPVGVWFTIKGVPQIKYKNKNKKDLDKGISGSVDMTKNEAYEKLRSIGQEHVLEFFDELDASEKESLLKQIKETDFDVLKQVKNAGKPQVRGEFSPLAAMQLDEIEKNKKEFTDEGEKLIKQGKVAALLLAGGMGTRLGSDEPKGVYDIGVTKPVYIFQRLIENLLDVVKKTDSWIRLFIMTSEKNHEATIRFLEEKEYFGYKKELVSFFKQDMAPACDRNGKLFLETKSRIATSPNGNGGWCSSFMRSGLGEVLKKESIEWINVFAVDNVLQKMCDPCFIGATAKKGVAVGAKVVKKANPDEKVGVMCLEDGKPSIVEYYELSEEMRNEKDANGDPAYNYGVILNYVFHVEELEEVSDNYLESHIVEKKIPYIDEKGDLIKPEEPNGYKFEQLILDMINQIGSCLPYEVVREKEFAPIKNATGTDSVESARELCKQNGIEL